MVVADVEALRTSFSQKCVLAAERALNQINRHAGETSALSHLCFYLWQAMDVCYHYAKAWQVVVDCALEAHEQMLRAGRWARWKDFLEMALSSSRNLGDKQAEMTLLLYLGCMQERCGEWSLARTRLEQVVALADQLGDRSTWGRALTSLANLERQAGQMEEAQQKITQALEVFEGTDDISGLSEAYRVLGNLYLRQGNNANALITYFEALKHAEASGDLGSLASIYHNLGTICAQQGDSAGAASYYHQALDLFQQAADPAGEALTLSNIGLACQADRGYWRPAIETFRQAAALAAQSGYFQGETGALGYLVDILLKLGEVDQAVAAIEQLRDLYAAANSAYGRAIVEHYGGKVCLARGDAETALTHWQRAQEYPELRSDPEDMAQAETGKGRAYALLGRWQEAETAFRQALDQWATTTEWPGELETWLSLAELYRQMDAWEKWELVWEQTRSLARRIERQDAMAQLDAALGDAHLAASQTKAGCDAYETALRRLAQVEENDRLEWCYQLIVEQARAQVDALERAGRESDAAALRASLQRGMQEFENTKGAKSTSSAQLVD